jgi:hypothetical protein
VTKVARYLKMSLGPTVFASEDVGGNIGIVLDTAVERGFLPFGGKRSWRLDRMSQRRFRALKDNGFGYYTEGQSSICLYSPSGDLLAEIWTQGMTGGKATAFHQGSSWGASGTWSAATIDSPKFWFGIQVKGSVGLFAGAEAGFGAVVNSVRASNGASLFAKSWRVGVVGGASGGVGILLATGFSTAREMNGFESDGMDWALSFGPRWSETLKAAGKLSKIEGAMHFVLELLDRKSQVERLTKVMKNPELTKEIYGIGKSLTQGVLIDDEYKGICGIDIPLGGVGAEIGFYYAKSGFTTLSEW